MSGHTAPALVILVSRTAVDNRQTLVALVAHRRHLNWPVVQDWRQIENTMCLLTKGIMCAMHVDGYGRRLNRPGQLIAAPSLRLTESFISGTVIRLYAAYRQQKKPNPLLPQHTRLQLALQGHPLEPMEAQRAEDKHTCYQMVHMIRSECRVKQTCKKRGGTCCRHGVHAPSIMYISNDLSTTVIAFILQPSYTSVVSHLLHKM
jgi:hypothetical protein